MMPAIVDAPAINALVPELAVSDIAASLAFYRRLGFETLYERPGEGFAFLALGDAQIMLDEIGRTRDLGTAPLDPPLGRGMNLQITVPAIAPLLDKLRHRDSEFVLPEETREYRAGTVVLTVRQFAVADPDGYVLRFSERVGERVA